MKKRFSEEQIVVKLREIATAEKPVPEAHSAAGIILWSRASLAAQRR